MTLNASRGITNSADVIDSRDVIARIEALEDSLAARYDEFVCDNPPRPGHFSIPFADWLKDMRDQQADDEALEYFALCNLRDEAEGSPDWPYGETLIRDSYFKEYAQQLADDIGAIDRNANWPTNCIDWDYAAEQLKADYTEIDFDGAAYWIRS